MKCKHKFYIAVSHYDYIMKKVEPYCKCNICGEKRYIKSKAILWKLKWKIKYIISNIK